MKKIFLLILVFSFGLPLYAQTEIDRINSDSAAMQYFKKYVIRGSKESNYNDFKLTSGKEWTNYYNFNSEQIATISRNFDYVSWAKTDLDGDGKADLILSGYLSKKIGESKHYRLFVFLSNAPTNQERLEVNNFVVLNAAAPQYFRLINIDTSTYIELSRWGADLFKTEAELPLRLDTLDFIASLAAFVDYKQVHMPNDINKVILHENFSSGILESVVINNKTRLGDFKISVSGLKGKKPETHTAKISKDLMQDFLDIASRLRYYKRLSTTPMMDPEPEIKKTLEVEYTNGDKLLINDNMGNGSFTTSALYTWFELSINNVYEQISQPIIPQYYSDSFEW